MSRYIPIVAGVLLIVGLTIAQGIMTDRLAGANVSVEQRSELLKLVPMNFDDWEGEDKKVDEYVKEVAGSVGTAVSRSYRNSRTGERVDLWLIVGHARDISAHTPNICYPASGFVARSKENGLYPFVMEGKEIPFLTNTFHKEDVTGRHLIRVFWTWFNSASEENDRKVVWEAPHNARYHFGNSRALFKMYFTNEMRDLQETAEQSASIHFARDFLPEVEKALAGVYDLNEGGKAATETKSVETTSGTDATATKPSGDDTPKADEGAAATDSSSSETAPATEAPASDAKAAE